MSNLPDKLNSKRTPLSQLNNTISTSLDAQFGLQDHSLITTLKPYNQRNDEKGIMSKQKKDVDQSEVESEYVKTIKKALREAVDENDILRKRVEELEALMSAAQDEIEQKDKAILELANMLETQKAARRENQISPRRKKSLGDKKSKRKSRSSEDKLGHPV